MYKIEGGQFGKFKYISNNSISVWFIVSIGYCV